MTLLLTKVIWVLWHSGKQQKPSKCATAFPSVIARCPMLNMGEECWTTWGKGGRGTMHHSLLWEPQCWPQSRLQQGHPKQDALTANAAHAHSYHTDIKTVLQVYHAALAQTPAVEMQYSEAHNASCVMTLP